MSIGKGSDLTLHLIGPAHAQVGGHLLPLRRKGLALLCVLALDGPARRERLADLLWDQRDAMRNLRVELHRLRAAFHPHAIDPFGGSSDPLSLHEAFTISAERGTGVLMEGLEDLATEFQAWLEYKRATWVPLGNGSVRHRLVEDLAGWARPPFVVVLQGSPGSGRQEVARSLARRLALPLVVGVEGATGSAAVRYVDPEGTDPVALARQVGRDGSSVWVVARSTFGEDPSLVLRLRVELPPERLRFVRLPPLTWEEARKKIPEDAGFDEAARLYLDSAGNPGYLDELLEIRARAGPATSTHVPQRMRAAFELEARRLPKPIRRALERLALIDGPLTPRLLAALGATGFTEELERTGWLVFEDGVWCFGDPAAALALRGEVHEGERRRILALTGAVAGETIQAPQAVSPGERGGGWDAGAERPHTGLDRVQASHGDEVWLDDGQASGPDATLTGAVVTWVHHHHRRWGASEVVWSLPLSPILLRLTGRVHVPPHDDGPAPAGVRLLRLSAIGAASVGVDLIADRPTPAERDEGRHEGRHEGQLAERVERLSPEFDRWFLLRDARSLRISGGEQPMVAEFTVRAYRPADVGERDAAVVTATLLGCAHDVGPAPCRPTLDAVG